MPASASDFFVKGARKWSGQLGASGVSNGTDTTIPLVSVTNLPTDTAVELVIDRVDANGTKTPDKEEVVRGTVSGTNIINCVRGVEGTAQAHAGGAVVEVRLTNSMWKRLIDGLLVSLTQTGKLLQSALDGPRYAADAGGDDTYAVTLDPAPSAYYAGMEVNFKPTTANTGACTLDVNGLGAKTIKKDGATDLATGDIIAGQVVKVIYDGTNFQIQSPLPLQLETHDGFTRNIKIVPSAASNALTLAVKGKDGNDLSSTNVGYVYLGGAWRSITGALSITIAQGTTNTFNSGSAELTAKEVDYFAHFVWDGSVVRLGMARAALGGKYGLFSSTATSEKYMALSGGTPSATAPVCVIGRFAATCTFSTPNYNWTVPSYDDDNLVQGPIVESRWNSAEPSLAVSGGTAPTYSSSSYKYRVIGATLFWILTLRNNSGGTAGAGANALTWQSIFDPSNTVSDDSGGCGMGSVYESGGTICGIFVCRQGANKLYGRNVASVASISGADQSDANRILQAQGMYTF